MALDCKLCDEKLVKRPFLSLLMNVMERVKVVEEKRVLNNIVMKKKRHKKTQECPYHINQYAFVIEIVAVFSIIVFPIHHITLSLMNLVHDYKCWVT